MARSRRFLDDIAYSEEHRHRLPQLYGRVGHRLDMADRDFTEFCHHCKHPLMIQEQVWYRGQNLYDKGTTVTRKLAALANVPAYLMAYTLPRPREVQKEIDRRCAELMRLQTLHPITEFRMMPLHPSPGKRKMVMLSPEEYWNFIFLVHRDHHRNCPRAAANGERPVNEERLNDAKGRSELWMPLQELMPL